MKITEAEYEERKLRIIHKAFQLFSQSGIDKVSIKDVAHAAKVSEKSVYRYFGSKVRLLLETVEMLWKEIVSELSATIDDTYENKSGYEQIAVLLDGFRHLFEDHDNYILFSYDYKLYLIRHSEQLGNGELAEVLRPLQEMYIRALKKGQRDGSIVATENADDLYWAIWGLMRGYVVKIVIYDRMLHAGGGQWRSRFHIACRLILRGLAGGQSGVAGT